MTQRGRSGGYRLCNNYEKLTLGRIVRELESDYYLVECFNKKENQCAITPYCKVKKQMAMQEKKLLDEIVKATGVAVEPWVSTSIAKVFDFFGLEYSRTEKSGSPSFTKQFLSHHPHPVAKKIVKNIHQYKFLMLLLMINAQFYQKLYFISNFFFIE